MSLIYMYVGKYNNINQEKFLFDKNYNVDFELYRDNNSFIGKPLSISKNDSNPQWSFGNNIENITAIIGKNGTGKSSILKLLSSNYHNVKTIKAYESPDLSYFIIRGTDVLDEYVIEGNDSRYIQFFRCLIVKA